MVIVFSIYKYNLYLKNYNSFEIIDFFLNFFSLENIIIVLITINNDPTIVKILGISLNKINPKIIANIRFKYLIGVIKETSAFL